MMNMSQEETDETIELTDKEKIERDAAGCSKIIDPGTRQARRTCNRNAAINHDGKWYCKQHNPVVEAEKEQLRWDYPVQTRPPNRYEIEEATKELVTAALAKWDHPAVTKYREQVYGKGGK